MRNTLRSAGLHTKDGLPDEKGPRPAHHAARRPQRLPNRQGAGRDAGRFGDGPHDELRQRRRAQLPPGAAGGQHRRRGRSGGL